MSDPAYPTPPVYHPHATSALKHDGVEGLSKYEWLMGHILPAFLITEVKEGEWEERAWEKAVEFTGRITSE